MFLGCVNWLSGRAGDTKSSTIAIGAPRVRSSLLRWVESRSWRSSGWIAILTAIISFVLFRVLLRVSLPAGVIPLPRGW